MPKKKGEVCLSHRLIQKSLPLEGKVPRNEADEVSEQAKPNHR